MSNVITTITSEHTHLTVQPQLILLATNLKDENYTLTKEDIELLRQFWYNWKHLRRLYTSELKLIPRTTLAFLIGYASIKEHQLDRTCGGGS